MTKLFSNFGIGEVNAEENIYSALGILSTMVFEMVVRGGTPLTDEGELTTVAKTFLTRIGYISRGADATIPLRLFLECLLRLPERAWNADELAIELATSRPTVYRHLNKLKRMDILEEMFIAQDDGKKAYRLRYGSLSRAWSFVEAHANVSMESYRTTVNDIQERLDSARPNGALSKAQISKYKVKNHIPSEFELILSGEPLQSAESELESVICAFLTQIGYIAKGSTPKVPLSLFSDCFVARPDKLWHIDELAQETATSRPTVYRHLNKLKGLDIVEEILIGEEAAEFPYLREKAYYRLRFGDLSKAWNFVEAHTNNALENYRKTVHHIQKLVETTNLGLETQIRK